MTQETALTETGAASGANQQPAIAHGANGSHGTNGSGGTNVGQATNATNGTNVGNAASGAHAQGARDGRQRDEATLLPPVDVIEDKTGITLFADLPGVAKESLEVRVEADQLLIEGQLGLTMPEGMAAAHAEVQTTRYRRTFTLSKELDPEGIEAEFERGVLRLRIPKAADAQPRRVAVTVH